LYAANRRRGRHESRFGLLLHHVEQGVQLIDSIFGRADRLLQPLIHGGDGLAHLLNIHPDRRRDVVYIVRDRAGVPHQRIDVAVDLVQHVADFLVALSEVPCGGDERDRQDDDGDRHDAARYTRDLAPETGLRHDLLRVDRIGKRANGLQQQLGAPAHPSHHVREVCKGEAI